MGGRGPAKAVAPLQAKAICVELDERCDRVFERQDAVGSRRRAKQTFVDTARWSALGHQAA